MKKQIIMATTLALVLSFNIAAAEACSACKVSPIKQVSNTKMNPKERANLEQGKKFSETRTMTDAQRKEIMEKRKAEFNKELGLTEPQIAQAKTIREAGHEKMKPLVDEMRAKKKAVLDVKTDATLSEKEKNKEIAKLDKEMQVIRDKANVLRDENEKEFTAILTPEQVNKYNEMKEDRKKHHEKMRKDGRPDMPMGPGPKPATEPPVKK